MKSPTKRQRVSEFVGWGRCLFLVAGVLALTYCGYVWLDTTLYQAYQARRFDQALLSSRSPVGVQPDPPPVAAGGNQIGGSTDDGSLLGRIEIRRLGLKAMILEGTEEATLRRAVGHVAGTPLPGQPGNVGLAAHRDTFFRGLRDVQVDDEIILTTLNGPYRYRVESTKVVAPDDTDALAASDEAMLTLVTCYPFDFIGSAPERFIVRAHLLF